jgi:protein-L-isoaspartate(D-aspartate) O-methyltransferase
MVGLAIDLEAARTGLARRLAREITDRRVLAAIARVPRERFVPAGAEQFAYEDRPLAIGGGQTISQPYIVALMTEKLALTGNEKVLELGTGSGYQTAILAELAGHVVSTERLPELAAAAARRLDDLGYDNITLHPATAVLGWRADAPYDAIIATAGAPRIPDELVDQLAIGGRLVIPVGPREVQELCRLTRRPQGNRTERLGACRFVSLIGAGAWPAG